MKQLSEIKHVILETNVPDSIVTTVRELPDLIQSAVQRDYTVSIYKPFKNTPISGRYEDVKINPHGNVSNDTYTTDADSFIANLKEYYTDGVKVHVDYFIRDGKYILMSINMSSTWGDSGIASDCLLNSSGKTDVEATPATLKQIAEFIEGRTGSIIFSNVYYSHRVNNISAKDVLKQVSAWSKLPDRPVLKVNREPVDHMATDNKQWFTIELHASEEVMTPKQWKDYSAGMHNTDKSISDYYASKSSGGYTGD